MSQQNGKGYNRFVFVASTVFPLIAMGIAELITNNRVVVAIVIVVGLLIAAAINVINVLVSRKTGV